MKRLILLLSLLILAVGFWLYTHSDRAQIRGLFRDIEGIASRTSAETVMEGALRAQSLAAFVANRCRLSVPEFAAATTMSRDDFAGAVLASRSGARVLSVRFRNLEIDVDSGRSTVRGVLDLTGSELEDVPTGAFQRPFSCVLEKESDGKWRFVQIALMPERS